MLCVTPANHQEDDCSTSGRSPQLRKQEIQWVALVLAEFAVGPAQADHVPVFRVKGADPQRCLMGTIVPSLDYAAREGIRVKHRPRRRAFLENAVDFPFLPARFNRDKLKGLVALADEADSEAGITFAIGRSVRGSSCGFFSTGAKRGL